jgi:endonuclease/exonuclease/phosphatase (EEP) superfamily protein YafD
MGKNGEGTQEEQVAAPGEGENREPGKMRMWLERSALGLFWGPWAVLMLMYGVVSDRTAWGELVTIWPPMLWLLGLGPLALLTMFVRRRRWRHLAAAAVAALAVFFLAAEEWAPMLRMGRAVVPKNGGAAVRVVTWNADSRDGTAILRVLEGVKPDIALIQESPDGAASIQPGQLMDGAFAGYHWLDAGDCAVLSRWEIEVLPTERVGPWSPPQRVGVRLPNGLGLHVFNVRLMLPQLSVNPLNGESRGRFVEAHQARVRQFEKLAAMTGSYGFVILGGDFNTPAHAASLGPLREDLCDAWKQAGRGWGRTILEDFAMARIDQVWVSGEIGVWRAWTEATGLSDHRMVVVDCVVGE